MAETKQYSIKLNLEDPREKIIHEFLEKKPTTHTVLEALTLYMRFEEARKVAIENAISMIAAPTISTEQYKKLSPVPSSDDDIKEFDL
jgi:hypothetical protein